MSTISRRTFLATLGLTALGALLTACGGSVSMAAEARSNKPRQSAPQVAPDDLRAFAAGHNRFGLAMYRLLGDGNLFFSPYSIAQVLTMTSAGARGQTAQQMAQALHSAFPQERLHSAANALDQALNSRGAGEDGLPPGDRQLDLGPAGLRLPAGVPRHAGDELWRRAAPARLQNRARAKPRHNQCADRPADSR